MVIAHGVRQSFARQPNDVPEVSPALKLSLILRPATSAVVAVDMKRLARCASAVETAQNQIFALPSLAWAVQRTWMRLVYTATSVGVHSKSTASTGTAKEIDAHTKTSFINKFIKAFSLFFVTRIGKNNIRPIS
jgi:hypothetical protein